MRELKLVLMREQVLARSGLRTGGGKARGQRLAGITRAPWVGVRARVGAFACGPGLNMPNARGIATRRLVFSMLLRLPHRDTGNVAPAIPASYSGAMVISFIHTLPGWQMAMVLCLTAYMDELMSLGPGRHCCTIAAAGGCLVLDETGRCRVDSGRLVVVTRRCVRQQTARRTRYLLLVWP